MVRGPTRKDNTLDVFITNRPSLVSRSEIIPGMGDHEAVFINSRLKAPKRKPPARRIDLWSKADTANLKSDAIKFKNSFLDKFSLSDSVEEMWTNFSTNMTKLKNEYVPSKLSSTRTTQPWTNSTTKRLSRRKKRSFKKQRKSKKKRDIARYHRLKTESQRECRKAYHSYIQNFIDPEAKSNPKKFWAFIKSKRQENSGVAPLRNRDGILYSDSKMKAEILNEQFSSVFNKDEDDEMPDMGSSPHPPMDRIKVTEKGVYLLLARMEPHKATGPDRISAQILKLLAVEITPVLTLLFQASLDHGVVPLKW